MSEEIKFLDVKKLKSRREIIQETILDTTNMIDDVVKYQVMRLVDNDMKKTEILGLSIDKDITFGVIPVKEYTILRNYEITMCYEEIDIDELFSLIDDPVDDPAYEYINPLIIISEKGRFKRVKMVEPYHINEIRFSVENVICTITSRNILIRGTYVNKERIHSSMHELYSYLNQFIPLKIIEPIIHNEYLDTKKII